MKEDSKQNPPVDAPTWAVADYISLEEKASVLNLVHIISCIVQLFIFFTYSEAIPPSSGSHNR